MKSTAFVLLAVCVALLRALPRKEEEEIFPLAILKGPQSQVVSAGSDGVTFGCRIKGEAQEWTINGKFSSFPRNQRLIQSGVVFHDRVRVNGMVDSSIIIPATIAFNSTTLVCLATNASISLSGSVAVLTIAGPPLPPAPTLRVINSTALEVWWDEPFTWDEFPIQQYTVTMHNSSSDSQPQPIIVYERWILVTQDAETKTYYELRFEVTATNSNGESALGTIYGGFPVESPFAPRNVAVSSVTKTSVSLSWTAPEYSGGRDRSEITYMYTVTYTASFIGVPEKQITGVSVTSVEVEGLIPFLDYTFSITAENAVSSHDRDVTARTTNINITTEEGVAAKVTNVMPVGTDIIEWSPPHPPHGKILYYNIKIVHLPNGEENLILGYDRTFASSDVWTNEWNVTDSFIIKVQAVTRIGAGEFSEPVSITISTTIPSDDTTRHVSTILLISILVPAAVVVLLIVGALFIMGHLSGRISRKRRSSQQTHRKNVTEHNIEEYASIKIESPQGFSDDSALFSSPHLLVSPRPNFMAVPNLNTHIYDSPDADLKDSAYAVLECPMQTRSSEFSRPLRAGPKVQDHTYGVLEGPTAKNPISNSATIDGDDDENGEERESDARGSQSDATNKFERLYFELENPNKSSVLTKREEQHELTAPPLSESVMSDAYWNDSMGPPGCVLVTPTHNSRQPSSLTHVLPPPTLTSTPESPCATDQSTTTGDPTYIQLSSQNAE